MLKSELRRQMRQLKQQFTPEELSELSLDVIARLSPYLTDAQTVLAYYSLPDEVCTHQLLEDLVAQGKTVLLPKVLTDDTMELRRYIGPDSLSEGAFHIMEPIGEPFTDYTQIDLALIPGMAFDAQGRRLGRGRGYYDRFLSQFLILNSQLRTIGVCFDFQKVAEVPVGPHDVSVNMVL